MIVRLMGGLGNQMFQYAFGRSISAFKNEHLAFTKSFGQPVSHIQYQLDVFDIPIVFNNAQLPVYTEQNMVFNPKVYNAPSDTVYAGWWQTEKYFNESLVRSDFSKFSGNPGKENTHIAKIIQAEETPAFIQVRRGDYADKPSTKAFHGLQSLEYYMTGISHILSKRPNARFFVFSDDPAWCRSHFPSNYAIVASNDWKTRTAQWDLWLMSMCRHGVIANSSFGWWGAWLGDTQQNRIIVAPKQWFTPQAGLDDRDIVPNRWTKI